MNQGEYFVERDDGQGPSQRQKLGPYKATDLKWIPFIEQVCLAPASRLPAAHTLSSSACRPQPKMCMV